MTMTTVLRRALLVLCVSLVSLPGDVAAQSGGKTYRVGILEPYHPKAGAHLIEAFRQGLREVGWEEGRNVVIDARFAEGDLERLPALAAQLAQLQPDVIVAGGTPAIRAARAAAPKTPVIMAAVGDPVAEGLVKSVAKPGGLITGVTNQTPDLSGKRIQLIREAVPRVSRLAIVWDPRIVHEVHGFKESEVAARGMGMSLLSFEVKRAGELDTAFAAMVRDGANGVFVFPNSITSTYGPRIADLAIRYRLPAIAGVRELAEAGCLLAYGPVRTDNYRRAAQFVDQVLRGARPGDLPIQQPTKFELVVNLRTARTLGVTIPQALLLRADQVLE